jgi:4'-phosphopantetheinyl transferase EntD
MTHRVTGSLEQSLEWLLPRGAAYALWDGEGEPDVPHEESVAVERAVPKRRLEFARGRACARRALSTLGVVAGPIPVGAHREPLWPEGVVGSITHCTGLVCAAVASRADVLALGIDAEPARPLDQEVATIALTSSERASTHEADLHRTVVFSAKESVHKTLFPLERIALEFDDVSIHVERSEGTFTVSPLGPRAVASTNLPALEGRFIVVDGFVMTAAFMMQPTGRLDW